MKNKKEQENTQKKHGPEPLAALYLLIGQPMLLAALCYIAAWLYSSEQNGDIGIRLPLFEMIEYIAISCLILYSGALLLDYLEKRQKHCDRHKE